MRLGRSPSEILEVLVFVSLSLVVEPLVNFLSVLFLGFSGFCLDFSIVAFVLSESGSEFSVDSLDFEKFRGIHMIFSIRRYS